MRIGMDITCTARPTGTGIARHTLSLLDGLLQYEQDSTYYHGASRQRHNVCCHCRRYPQISHMRNKMSYYSKRYKTYTSINQQDRPELPGADSLV